MPAVFKVSVEFEKHFTYADFDKKTLKKFLRKIGTQTARTARSLLKRGGKGQVSQPGKNPLVQSGVTTRSIKGKPSHSGFSSVVAPFKTPKMGPEFYPAATFYGHRGPGKGLVVPENDVLRMFIMARLLRPVTITFLML